MLDNWTYTERGEKRRQSATLPKKSSYRFAQPQNISAYSQQLEFLSESKEACRCITKLRSIFPHRPAPFLPWSRWSYSYEWANNAFMRMCVLMRVKPGQLSESATIFHKRQDCEKIHYDIVRMCQHQHSPLLRKTRENAASSGWRRPE